MPPFTEVHMRRVNSSSLWGWLVAVAMVSAALSGCESPAMQRARQVREEAFGRDIEQIKSLESRRSEKLQATAKMFESQAVSDRQKLDTDLKAVADWLPGEVRKWNSKQAAYQEAIRHQLEGRPASIENTVPHFIY
jgi:hypothetical protein